MAMPVPVHPVTELPSTSTRLPVTSTPVPPDETWFSSTVDELPETVIPPPHCCRSFSDTTLSPPTAIPLDETRRLPITTAPEDTAIPPGDRLSRKLSSTTAGPVEIMLLSVQSRITHSSKIPLLPVRRCALWHWKTLQSSIVPPSPRAIAPSPSGDVQLQLRHQTSSA